VGESNIIFHDEAGQGWTRLSRILVAMTIGVGPGTAVRIIQNAHSDTLADYVDAAVDPLVAGGVISAAALADIRHVAGRLPGAITDFFGFECDLGNGRAQADFGVCCRTSHVSQDVLSGERGWDPFSAFHEHTSWHRIRRFCREWAKAGSELYTAVHNIWFEFDIDGSLPQVPLPSVFIGSHRLQASDPVTEIEGMQKQGAWLTDVALPILAGAALDPALRRQVVRCIGVLPPNARVFQAGLMLARGSQAVRLCLRGIATSQIEGYLRNLDWPGRSIELKGWLDSLELQVERIDLALDVTDRVLPRVGLECYVGATESRLSALLDYLVARRLCTAAEAEGLTSWPATVDETSRPEAWPRDLLTASRELGGTLRSAFVRNLHHVKLDYRPEAPFRAKAYLGVHHRWLAENTGESFEGWWGF
jgi:hypothetical protein